MLDYQRLESADEGLLGHGKIGVGGVIDAIENGAVNLQSLCYHRNFGVGSY